MSNPEGLIAEVAEIVSKELDMQKEVVQKILAHIAVDGKEYKSLMIREVVGEVWVAAQFAFPPHNSHTPEEVKKKALDTFHKKLERDKRLFST